MQSLRKTIAILVSVAGLSSPMVAQAVITVSGVSEASAVDVSASNAITIYGGIAGEASRCADGGASQRVCDNCLLRASEPATLPLGTPDNLLLACNQRRINPNTILTINVSSDALDGQAVITDSDGDTALSLATSPVTVTKGNAASISISWNTLCTAIFAADTSSGGGSGCVPVNGTASGNLRVGISSDGDTLLNQSTDDQKSISFVIRNVAENTAAGTPSLTDNCASAGTTSTICYFEVGAGDEKAIVRTLLAPTGSTFPTTENTKFKFVRFLFSTQGFNYITLASNFVDLPISSSGTTSYEVSPKRIEGLTNDTTYYFKSALVDAAGNVGLYSQAANDTTCENAAVPGPDCRVITPSEVVGVLAQTNCFIATAAYGSPLTKELNTLRDFRDQVLMTSRLGKSFVRWYYDTSPKAAAWILSNDTARTAVRAALLPTVWFAGIALAYGPWTAGLSLLTAIIVLAALLHIGRRQLNDRRSTDENSSSKVSSDSSSSLSGWIPWVILPFAILLATGVSTPVQAQDIEANADDLGLRAFEDETPPEPEYPYPGARGSLPETAPTAQPEIDFDAEAGSDGMISAEPFEAPPTETKTRTKRAWPPPKKVQTGRFAKPRAIDEEGTYYYEKTTEPAVRNHGRPKAKKFSNLPGREKPATIKADGEFTYPVRESGFSGAAGVRFGVVSAPKITNSANGLTFKDIYGAADLPALIIEYEYPFTKALGRIGMKFETGFITKQAPGRFKNPARAAEIPEERFTFLMVPLQAMLHYRFQFSDTQFFVPFAEGGAGYGGIVELRDDNKKPRFAGAPSLIAGGGVNILMDWIDRSSVRQLDADYGINHVWFTAQYRQIIGLKKDVDVSSRMISAGFTFDF